MLVALATGLMVLLAALTVQVGTTNHNMRLNDTNQRDNEVRAALDMVTKDLAAAGFLLTPDVPNCSGRLNYNSALPSPYYYATNAVSAFAGAAGTALPMVTAGSLTLDYPVATSTNRSDVLVLSRANDATQYGTTASPTVQANANTAYHPMTTGLLPVASTASLGAGHVGLVQVPINGATVCLRVPIDSLGSASSSANVGSSSSLMPSNYYTGLSAQLATAGVTANSLSDALLMQSRLVDMGTAAASNQATYVYYVSGTAYAWPTLMRAQINAANDTLVTTQPVAAGVVSLQVLFGVDTTGSGSVSAYQTGATVAANQSYASIRSVRIGIIARTLYADQAYTAPATLTLPGTSVSIPFTAYTVPSTSSSEHYTIQTTEVALRNTLWTP